MQEKKPHAGYERVPTTPYSRHSERSEESSFADPSATPQDDMKTTVSSDMRPV